LWKELSNWARFDERFRDGVKWIDPDAPAGSKTINAVALRIHGLYNRERSWVMRIEEIEGLSPQQIKDKFALPETPQFITEITVPEGTRMRVGEASGNKYGAGGGTQYELLQRLEDPSLWKNTRKLGE